MTAALEGGEWSAARPGRTLPPGKTRYPFYRGLVAPRGRAGRAENPVIYIYIYIYIYRERERERERRRERDVSNPITGLDRP